MTALEQTIIADVSRLTADEQQALRYILDRILVQGRASYAPWRADTDQRDIDKEIADECADALVYSGMRAVMRHTQRRARLECETADACDRVVRCGRRRCGGGAAMSDVRTLIQSRHDWLTVLTEQYKVKAAQDGDVVSLKYNQIESPMWEPLVQQCRGMVVDVTTQAILAHPYDKFWNLGEELAASIDWPTARVLEKLDGSLMILYWNGGWQVASSGHPTAGGSYGEETRTFRDAFWETWKALGMGLPDGWLPYCFMFEFCANAHRIVCKHEQPRIVLHGARDMVTGLEISLEDLTEIAAARRWEMVKSYPIGTAADALVVVETLDPIQTEGFVVVDAHFNRVKIKSPRYVALHHMKGEATPRRAIELWQTGETDEVLAHFPEFAHKIIPVQQALESAARCAFKDIVDGRGVDDRKTFAAQVKSRPWSAACFRHYDERHTTDLDAVVKTLRSQSLASLERLVDAVGVE